MLLIIGFTLVVIYPRDVPLLHETSPKQKKINKEQPKAAPRVVLLSDY
ncbi:hypothetical protein [Clostridium sp. LP20]